MCEPAARVAVLNTATPAFRVPVPSVTAPSLNVTVPVAVVGAIVAVRVTLCARADGFRDDASVSVVAALFTVCVTADEVLPVEATRAQMKFLNEGGFKIDYREYRKSHTIDLRRELREIREWIQARVPPPTGNISAEMAK